MATAPAPVAMTRSGVSHNAEPGRPFPFTARGRKHLRSRPAKVVQAPGIGSNARIRLATSAAGRVQSILATSRPIFGAIEARE